MGIRFAGRLSDLGSNRTRALSALPLVCGLETTPQRCLAQLPLNSGDLSHARRPVFTAEVASGCCSQHQHLKWQTRRDSNSRSLGCRVGPLTSAIVPE